MYNENDTLDLTYNKMTEDSELNDIITRIENGETLKGVRLA